MPTKNTAKKYNSTKKNYTGTITKWGAITAIGITAICKGPEYVKIFHPEYRAEEIRYEQRIHDAAIDNIPNILEKRADITKEIVRKNPDIPPKKLRKTLDVSVGKNLLEN